MILLRYCRLTRRCGPLCQRRASLEGISGWPTSLTANPRRIATLSVGMCEVEPARSPYSLGCRACFRPQHYYGAADLRDGALAQMLRHHMLLVDARKWPLCK